MKKTSKKNNWRITDVISFCCLLICLMILTNVQAQTMDVKKQHKIKITVGSQTVTATLYDNPTTDDFISLLPLTLDLKDYAGTEKINYLPKKLSTKDAPAGTDPQAGDITYYAPWGNLALFYKDFEYSTGLIMLGKIDGNIEMFKTPSIQKAKFELVR